MSDSTPPPQVEVREGDPHDETPYVLVQWTHPVGWHIQTKVSLGWGFPRRLNRGIRRVRRSALAILEANDEVPRRRWVWWGE